MLPKKPAEGVVEFRRIKPDFLYYSPDLRTRAKQLVAVRRCHPWSWSLCRHQLPDYAEARLQGRPLVYHTHGFLDPWILKRSRWKKRLVHWLFENANFQHARLWRALTSKEADQIRSQGIKSPVVVIPVGFDPAQFNISFQPGDEIQTPLVPRLINKRRFRAVFISRIHPKKGLDNLLPAWSVLAAKKCDWELIIAGPDVGGYAATVDRLIQKLNLTDSVRRVGKISHESKVKLLKSADLLVLPSYSEGFTSAILEAMAAAVPVGRHPQECNFAELFQQGGGWECEANTLNPSPTLSGWLWPLPKPSELQRGAAAVNYSNANTLGTAFCNRLLQACASYCNQ